MWHIGTLDPLASGLMLIATEQSTKLLSFLNSERKWYIFRVELDGKTDSLDLETPIIPVDTEKLNIPDKKFLEKKLLEITSQIPPKFSAIHIDGKRAYKIARKEKDFTIPERKIEVSEAEIIEIWDTNITIKIIISSGGYIRSFAPVVAEWCGVEGWYISLLHREKLFLESSVLTENQSQDIENFDKNIFISEQELFPEWKFFNISSHSIQENLHRGIIPDITELVQSTTEPENFEKILQKNWQKIFLTFKNNYSSLLEVTENGLKIIRNDVSSRK